MSTDDRYISVRESLEGACEEVSLMLQGKLKETTWDDMLQEFKNEFKGEVPIP